VIVYLGCILAGAAAMLALLVWVGHRRRRRLRRRLPGGDGACEIAWSHMAPAWRSAIRHQRHLLAQLHVLVGMFPQLGIQLGIPRPVCPGCRSVLASLLN